METFGISEKSYLLIIDVLKSYPEVEAAIIFGSRAKGNYKNGSDIDLALIGESLIVK
ncbi:MAG: nucleotidyltransferase domain-containing protein [Bacteroidota bacterium]